MLLAPSESGRLLRDFRQDLSHLLEVGGLVGCQEERPSVVREHPGHLGHVELGVDEVLDQVRRADVVEDAGPQRQGRRKLSQEDRSAGEGGDV